MFSGILVIIVTLIGMLLTALNLVREKEMGTTEQINVTPIRKYQFIMAKLIPFMVIALFELAFGLIIGRLLFELPMVGSLGLLFLFTVHLPVCGAGDRPVSVDHFQYPAAADVYGLLLYDHLYPDERGIYTGRQHARMGPED